MMIADLFAKLSIKPDKRSFDAADKMIGAVHKGIAALVAFTATKFIGGMVKETVDLGGKLDDLAQSTGQNVEEMQALGYAAKLNGSDLDTVSGGVVKLSKVMSEAANGNKEAAKSFRAIGVNVKAANGELRPATDVLEDIADHIAAMEDGTKKTALVMEFFGKSGGKLIPLLNNGGEGIRKFKEEAREMGTVISEESVKALADFGDEQDRVKMALEGIRDDAVIALLPTLKEMVLNLKEWIKANRQIIVQKLATLIKLLAKGLKIFGTVIGYVIDGLEFLGKHIDLVAVAFISLVAAIALFRTASIGAAIASGVAWFMANLPIVLLAAAIAAVILLVEDLYQWFTGGDSVLKDLWASFKHWFGEKITGIIEDNVEFWKLVFNTIFQWIEEKIEWLWNKAKAVKDWITGDDDPIKKELVLALNNPKLMYGSPEERAAAQKRLSDAKWQASNHEGAVPSLDLSSSATANPSTVQVTAPVTIQVSGSDNPEETARVVKATLGTWWADQLNATVPGVGGVK